MLAVILVGGEGTRLRPLTYETPKQMLPIVGVPMIECVMDQLCRHGVTDAVLALGYLPDSFTRAYPDNEIGGVRVTYAVEPAPLDTAGAIRFAATSAGVSETFLVVNGDVLTDLDITRLLSFHRERGAEATIALHPVEDPSRYGVVVTSKDGRVSAFIEKPPRDEAPTNRINAGTYVMEPSVLSRIAPAGRVSVERDTFPALAGDGTLFAMTDDAYWLDTGTPQTYLRANADVLAGLRGHTVHGVVGGSWVHPSARVDPSASLAASVVDRAASVGARVVMENVVMMPGAVIEEGATVRWSIIGPGAVVGSGSELDATCVVGANERVAPGSMLSGDVRLGGV
ncbi:MAG: NDP-sugar synthase [Acidobacteriota bacterium]|nr:NDP-sugar synthase [Acidobacteriota bacterium]